MILEIKVPAAPEGFRWVYRRAGSQYLGEGMYSRWGHAVILQKPYQKVKRHWFKAHEVTQEWMNVGVGDLEDADRLNPDAHRAAAQVALDSYIANHTEFVYVED